MRVRFASGVRPGKVVLRMERVAKAYGEKVVYRSLDFELARGERVALVGPNGAGKSTLLRLAAGALEPDGGARELGHNVHCAFYAQHQVDALDARRTVLGELEHDALTDDVPRLRSILGAFLFSGDEIDKKVAVLSGGEKARLALAKLLLARANFLVLDEPTNHLDMEARDVLTQALADYDGTLLFVSHDRLFIDTLATRVVEITPGEDEARVRVFLGGYATYAEALERDAEAAAEAARPAPKPAAQAGSQARRRQEQGQGQEEAARTGRRTSSARSKPPRPRSPASTGSPPSPTPPRTATACASSPPSAAAPPPTKVAALTEASGSASRAHASSSELGRRPLARRPRLVPRTGLEPACPFEHQTLNLACLPISPPGQAVGAHPSSASERLSRSIA